jgi:radial spoke head protein 4A
VPQDLYTHLTEVFNRILLHHSKDAFEKFEEISALVKKTDLKFQDPKYDFEVNAEYGAKKITPEEAWVARSKNLLNEVNDLVAGKDSKLLSKSSKVVMPDLAGEAEMLEWANISFGDEDTYRLQKAMKRLAVMSGAEALGFVGKIYGTEKDYWIVNGRLGSNEEPVERGVEPRGEGVN